MLRHVEMPGPIALALMREPSFFEANRVGWIDSQTLIHEEVASGRILGLGTRSILPAYVDGAAVDIGYLSQLRLIPEARRGLRLARGYAYLRELTRERRIALSYTTILDDNVGARSVLTSGRAGLPVYDPIATLVTFLIPVRARRRRSTRLVDAVKPDLLSEAVACVDRWNQRHALAPRWDVDRVRALRDFDPAHFYAYIEGNRVVGTLGVWDQSAFKQTVVTGYSPWIAISRPIYNTVMRVRRLPTLPAVGGQVKTAYAALISAVDDDPGVFGRLIDFAVAEWSGKGFDYLAVGLCRGHALESVVRRFACRSFTSTIYRIYWSGDKVSAAIRGPVHVEVSML